MTPEHKKDRESLLGQIRGLTAKVERLEGENAKLRASTVSATEVQRDYVATICGGCDRPKFKCSCSDGDCG
jgi:uncharacterized protein (UPF0335 family)